MDAPESLVIRGLRGVFRFERRLYRIDHWRPPLRQGLPVRALLHTPVAYVLPIAAAAVPPLGGALALLPAPLHWALLPVALVAGGIAVFRIKQPTRR
jgi:hypothetical protein